MAETLNASTHAIGCMAHVLHLAAQDGLKALSKGVAPTTCKQEEPPGPMAIVRIINPPDGLSLRYDSIISRVAQLASYLWKSPQYREKFAEAVKLIYDGPKPTNAMYVLAETLLMTCWSKHYALERHTISTAVQKAWNHFSSVQSNGRKLKSW
ncbi:hypothetical protein O181_120515 [Austropuccinia psidii MF-1]|uniref:HAT C-terminal dimerisation domain-containing protein n=1 Tax=Austropuccinia psidii MF-1 TaxID=1389203 RepID=A0A9Q3KFX6_9BASI|nr:hypothetical protein [Austropuccinia psidii MF-1]